MINFYRITVFAVLLWSAMQARAQSVFYQFSKSTSTYADLASPTMLTTTMMTNFEVMPVPAGLNQPVEMIDRERQLGAEPKAEARLAAITGDETWQPTFVFRGGYAIRDAAVSARRSVETVAELA